MKLNPNTAREIMTIHYLPGLRFAQELLGEEIARLQSAATTDKLVPCEVCGKEFTERGMGKHAVVHRNKLKKGKP